MGAGGEANHELGIANRDIENSASRRRFGDQYESHEVWSQRYMGERILGMGLALAFVILAMVWLIDIPSLYRYGVSAVVLIWFIAAAAIHISRRNRLQRIRAQQLRKLNE